MIKIIATVDRCPFDVIFADHPELYEDMMLVSLAKRYEAMRKRYAENLAKATEDDDDIAIDWLESHAAQYNSELHDLCDQFSAIVDARKIQL